MARRDDLNVPFSALIGLVGAVVLVVIIVGLQAFFASVRQKEAAKKPSSPPYQALRQLDAEQLERLNSYGWVNQTKGVAHIPIQRAMEIVAVESAQK